MVSTREESVSPSGTISGDQSLETDALLKGARRGLGFRNGRWRKLPSFSDAVVSKELVHHPLWLGKVLTYADRPPFPPKRTPNVVFVDAVSGYRGVLERVPAVDRDIHASRDETKSVIDSQEQAKRYVRAVLHTVNRGYVLKKPQHELTSLELVLLPLWQVKLNLDESRVVYVNAVTGEPESYMARLWGTGSWRSLDDVALAPLRPPRSKP